MLILLSDHTTLLTGLQEMQTGLRIIQYVGRETVSAVTDNPPPPKKKTKLVMDW